jgi:cation:H+ antiporter
VGVHLFEAAKRDERAPTDARTEALAVRLGVTPLLVGLTVVAYGTSTPELIVSSTAAVQGQRVSPTDTFVMIGFSVLLLIIAWTGFQLRRWEGALLLALYGGYMWHLWPAT